MKRFFYILLCFAMLMPGLAACAATDEGEASDSSDESEPASEPGVEIIAAPPAISGGTYTPASVRGIVPDALASIEIAPESAVNGIISASTRFIITTEGDTNADELAKYIRLSPETPYSITGEGRSFTLTPASLESDTVYSLTVGGEHTYKSFAFQTESSFFIKSVFPADLSTDVPTNTGIELTFSEPIALEAASLAAFVSVEPAVNGEFMLYPNRKTAAFVPEQALDDDTVYTVTVKTGIEGVSGRKLLEERAFAFRTSDITSTGAYTSWSFSLNEGEQTVPLGQTPRVGYYFYANNSSKQSDVSAKIYKYPSVSDAIAALKDYLAVRGDYIGKEYVFPSDGLTKIGEYSLTPETSGGGWYSDINYLNLPMLDGGVYLCEYGFKATVGGEEVEDTLYQLLSVTNICTYHECSDDEGLIWLNEIGGGAVSNARITCEVFENNDYWSTPESTASYTKSETSTDENGVARIDMTGGNAALVLIENGEDSRYLSVSRVGYNGGNSYYSHVYSDREVYFTDDTVRLHGIIAPKSGECAPPEHLTVETGYFNRDFTIPVDKNGAFDFSFDLEQYTGWGISVSFYDGDGNLAAQKYIQVTQESKPLYRATLEYDRPFYELGDTATLTLTASYFDGTPAPNLTFEIYDNNYNGRATLTTDDDGIATYSYTAGIPTWNPYSTSPYMIGASAYLTGLEDTSISLYASAGFFHSPVSFDAGREGERGEHTVVTLNEFDTSKITEKSDIYYRELILGEPVTGNVYVSLESYEYVKVSDGTTYNPITKLTTENFHYETNSKTLESYDATVGNGRLVLDNLERPDGFKGYYQYEIVYTEPATGIVYTSYVYAVIGKETTYYGDRFYYSLDLADDNLAVGERAEYLYTYGGERVEGGLLHLVYSQADKRLSEYGVTSDGGFSFEFTEDYIAGVYVSAAYFDGEKVQMLYASNPRFDYSSRALGVAFESDAESYRPGDTATINISVTDTDGNPVSGVCTVGIVDEACFALGEQGTDPLGDWYMGWTSFYPSHNEKISFIGGGGYYGKLTYAAAARGEIMDDAMVTAEAEAPMMNAADATGMGDGGEEAVQIREIFKDNPYFENIPLENGKAVIVFKAPDNITEWRVTAIAAKVDAEKGSAALLGAAKSGVICTLPMFVAAQITDCFVVGDDISCTARIAGSAVRGTDAANLTAELRADGTDTVLETLEASAAAGDNYIFRFGKYEAGQYSLTVTARSGEYSDGVKLPFSVAESGMIINISKTVKPEELISIKPLLYPVHISFTDGAYGDYLTVMDRLMWYKTSRSDSLASYYAAITASNLLFGDVGYYEEELERIKTELSSHDGLIPLIEYGEGSVELSAKIAAVIPEALSENARLSLIRAFDEIAARRVHTDDVELTAAYFGLAALGEPVLSELGYIYGGISSVEAKLYIAAAYAYAGDWGTASAVLTDAVKLTENENETYAEGGYTEETVKLTALALLTASKLDKEAAESMTRYLMSHTSSVDIYTLEMAAYLREFYPLGTTDAAFTLNIGEDSERIELGARKSHYVSLNKNEFENFSISDIVGEPIVRVFYRGGISEATGGGVENGELSVKKTITAHDEERGLYKVTLDYSVTFNRDFASFTLSDRIPSGARYYGAWSEGVEQYDWKGHVFGYISNDKTQMMSGRVVVWNGADYGEMINGIETRTVKGSVSYLIRAAAEGEFTIDGAVLQDNATGGYAISESGRVTIGGSWEVELD